MVDQLPTGAKRELLRELTAIFLSDGETIEAKAERELGLIAAKRGLSWNDLDDEARQELVEIICAEPD